MVGGSLIRSSCWINVCQRKLKICVKSSTWIPALNGVIGVQRGIFNLINSFAIMSGGILGYTLDNIILLFGLKNFRILICWCCIVINGLLSIRLFTNELLDRNIHKRPFDIRDANRILDGWTKLPIAMM